MPSPVIRMAPKPRRWTSRSPPMVKVSMRLTLATASPKSPIDLALIYQVGTTPSVKKL